MTAFRRWQVAPLALALALTLALTFAAGLGCSFVLNLDSAQCSTNGDCEKLQGAFAGSTCSYGTCVREGGVGGNGTFGDAATPDAGPPCVSNAECSRKAIDQPAICRVEGSTSHCVELKVPDLCTAVIDENATPAPWLDDNAIIVGGILDLVSPDPLERPSVASVALAFREFQASYGGIPGAVSGGPSRPLVAVLCRREPNVRDAVARHLFDEIGVRSVIAHLPENEMVEFYQKWAQPRSLFVFNPGYSTSILEIPSREANGRYWHAIGDARDLAPVFTALIRQVEARVKAAASIATIKLALVQSSFPTDRAVAAALKTTLQFNGKSYYENGASYLEQTYDAAKPDTYASVAAAIVDARPQVIVVMGREEFFENVAPAIEASWPTGATPPTYVLGNEVSPGNDPNDSLRTFLGELPAGSEKRFVGVAAESPADHALYDGYVGRATASFPKLKASNYKGGFENFYDTAYALAYAYYAAPGQGPPDALAIGAGMRAVVSGTAAISAAPGAYTAALTAIRRETRTDGGSGGVLLQGTMGPWTSDLSKFSRILRGSVYCTRRVSETKGANQFQFQPDVYRFDTSTKALINPIKGACSLDYP